MTSAIIMFSIMFLLSVPASAYEESAALLPSQDWAQYMAQNPTSLGVYSVTGVPSCNSMQLFIKNEGTITISSTCTLNYLSIEFVVPKGSWVYQQQGTKWNIVQQRVIAETTGGQYNKILATPLSLGTFTFSQELKADQVQQVINRVSNLSASEVRKKFKQSAQDVRSEVKSINKSSIEQFITDMKKRLERGMQKFKERLKWKKRL